MAAWMSGALFHYFVPFRTYWCVCKGACAGVCARMGAAAWGPGVLETEE